MQESIHFESLPLSYHDDPHYEVRPKFSVLGMRIISKEVSVCDEQNHKKGNGHR